MEVVSLFCSVLRITFALVVFVGSALITVTALLGSSMAEEGPLTGPGKTMESADMRHLGRVAAEDPFRDCNSCHKNKGDKDYSLETEVKRISDHPPVQANATLRSCLAADCHGNGDLRNQFGKTLHKKHAESRIFRPVLKGSCVSCHKLEKNGSIVLKGANTETTD